VSEITQKPSAHFSTAALALLEAVAWDENSEEDEERRRSGGETGGGPAFKDLIKNVRGSWKHLTGGALLTALKDFGVVTRASANMLVGWNGDFTVIQDIFNEIEEMIYGKERDRKRSWWRNLKKMAKKTGPSG